MRFIFAGAVALVLSLAAPVAAEPAPEAVAVYRHATLIDGTGAKGRPDMAILVRGERIAAVEPSAALAAPSGATEVDVASLYVLPGLINTHEHLATPPDRALAEAEMKKDLYGGVTAVRDMADDLRAVAELARAARVGEIAGPDIAFAALMAGPEFFEDPRTHAVTQGVEPGRTPWMQAIGPDTDLRQAVAEARGTGAVAIKLYADLPGATVADITREAHRQGELVWAHAAVFPASPREVIEAGVDAVSHVCMLAYQVQPMPRAYHNRAPVDAVRLAPGDDPVMQGLFDEMKRRGTVLDATLRVYAELDAAHRAHPGGAAPYCTPELAEQLTAQAYRTGVVISAGTDGFTEAADPWPSLQDELERLQDKAHLPAVAVLRAATFNGALAMHQEAQMGSVAVGKLANLVFTRQDPSADVHALRTVTLTVKRGKAFWRKDYAPNDKQGRGR